MEMFFKYKKPNIDKLSDFGFEKNEKGFVYSTLISDGQMRLFVYIDKDGNVSSKIIDVSSGEEYVLYRVPSAVGEFVGKIRKEYERVMSDISDSCFEPEIFKSNDAKAIMAYIKEKYDNDFEYLWEKFPDNAIVRRKDNRKWYALLLTVKKEKLGIEEDGFAEIIDIRTDSSEIENKIDNKHIFPGYHMNKKHWITICLDGTVSLEDIFRFIDESYEIAGKK